MKLWLRVLIVLIVVGGVVAGWWVLRRLLHTSPRDGRVIEWMNNPSEHPGWALAAGQRCGDAPFQMPTRGFIGYLWDDSWQPGQRHSGLDIFGGERPGAVQVIAAASGYLTRLPEWKSSLIVRIPSDPFEPGRQIWTYYTHMADAEGVSLIDAEFPPGTSEKYVESGTALGRMGNFSGTPGAPVGVHLHFSIVRDDGKGKFLDERKIENTLDPSPYLGMELNANKIGKDEIPACE